MINIHDHMINIHKAVSSGKNTVLTFILVHNYQHNKKLNKLLHKLLKNLIKL